MSFPPGSSNYTQAFGTNPENVEVPHIDSRAPSTSDITNYPVGKRWINKNTAAYDLLGFTVSGGITSATWALSNTSTGVLAELTGDSGGAITPAAGTGNISLLGTANQIVTTGTLASNQIVWSLSSTLVVPGTLTVTGTTSINATGTATTTIGGSSGLFTLASGSGGLTATGGGNTIQLFNDAAANIVTLGSTSGAASLTLQAGGGNMALTGATGTTYTIGSATGIGAITVGQSTAAETVNILSATSITGAQIVNLLNGATPGANTTLNIMDGAGTAGTQTVNILATGATRAGAVNINTGAAAHTLTVGSSSAGNIAFAIASGSTYSVTGNGGTITIGNDAAANTVSVGTSNTTATLNLLAGSGKVNITGAVIANSTVQASSYAATGDPGSGTASQNIFSNANSTTISTGLGTIHMSTANPATNTGWLKCYIGTQVAWIPTWTTNAP